MSVTYTVKRRMNHIEIAAISNTSPQGINLGGFLLSHDRNRDQYARASKINPNPIKIAGPTTAVATGPVINTSAPMAARMIATHVTQPM